MTAIFETRLKKLVDTASASAIRSRKIGLEKECLRVNQSGSIAQTTHPRIFGSALTHPYITTDYSEALMEFITPPCSTIDEALKFLCNTHKFVYENLDDEILWATSMPCVVAGETSIPVAQYGTSNKGKMKTVYREGLGYRYGKVMQVIAGVHFNYSFSDEFWALYQQLNENTRPARDYISQSYFDLLRNLQKVGWLIPYLFGASPAVCKSFLQGKETDLTSFNENTYYQPFATSLRMGNIGYQNNKENKTGVKANYNSLADYVQSLKHAIETPCHEYEKIGVKVNGEYRQLNANILQIENEYYSTVRPKQLLEDLEKPIDALQKRGVRYIELRSLDVNAYAPLGVTEEQCRFIEALMLYCLLEPSQEFTSLQQKEIDQNELLVAHSGRDPALRLHRETKPVSMSGWGLEVCDKMQGICEILDNGRTGQPYMHSLQQQVEALRHPDMTPSAVMLQEMSDNKEGFYHFAKRMSDQHADYFAALEMEQEVLAEFKGWASDSLDRQHEIEAADRISFDEFLASYFRQKA